MSHALSGCKILITRPQPQADSLARALQALGAEPTIFSTLDISPCAAPQLATLDLTQFGKIIFTSANAVQYSVPLRLAAWQQLPKHCHIISMGSGTSEVLQEYGVRVDFEPQAGATSETLLTAPVLQTVTQQKILLITGMGGRGVLADTLSNRGAELTTLAVYRRDQPQKPMPLWSENFDVIISTSGESLENLRTLLIVSGQEKFLQLPLLIISERMLHLAIAQGFSGALLVAPGASNAAIIERLVQWKTTT